MNKNIFATWLKEFTQLVLIQTIQAFIYAIVMSIIIQIMTPENINSVSDRSSMISAAGFIAVIALGSISQVENLVKKIFGVQSSIAETSMADGMKSLATAGIAVKLGKNVLDNGKKMGQGLSGIMSTNAQMRITKGRYVRDLSNKYAANQKSTSASSTTTQSSPTAQGGAPQAGAAQGQMNPARNTSEYWLGRAVSAKNAGDMDKYRTYMGTAQGIKISQNAAAAQNAAQMGAGGGSAQGGAPLGPGAAQGGPVMSNNVAAATSASATPDYKYEDDINKIKDTYEDKMRDLKKKRRESVYTGISGALETVGSIGGAIAGAAYGGAQGRNVVRDAVAGAGIGDLVAQTPMNTAKEIDDIATGISRANRSRENYTKLVSEAARNMDNTRTQIRKYSDAKKKFTEIQNRFDAGDID